MYRNILVLLDGSPFAEHALPLACGLARRSNAILHFTRVHTPIAPMYGKYGLLADVELERIARSKARDYLDQLPDRLPSAGRRRVCTALLEGDVISAIEQQVELVCADLVVMATHGYGPLSRFWLGSVADRLIRQLRTPILLVRPHAGPLNLMHEPEVKRLMIPLDGTPESTQIIQPAVDFGRLMGAEFLLLQVLRPVLVPATTGPAESFFWGTNVTPAHIEQVHLLQQKFGAEALAALDQIAAMLRAQSVAVKTQVIASVQPARAILDRVQEQSVDLVALETHGRHGVERVFIGSVADKVIRGAAVPIFLQRLTAG